MDLLTVLEAYTPGSEEERLDVERLRRLAREADPWTRHSALHATGSALVYAPAAGEVLLRWHDRQQAWLQVGGHADPGELDPFRIALREAREETGLQDLQPWPDPDAEPRLMQVVIVPVPAGKGEPPHEHADLRYVLATRQPHAVIPESESALLRWLPLDDAISAVAEENLRVCLFRLRLAAAASRQ
jgi:8-oxo-dGTP pyrophosphatase MutT (NUDIX family)